MKTVFTFLALLAATSCFSQYFHNVPSGTGKDLLSISFGSATTGYIGGADSIFLKTTDGGQTWMTLPVDNVFFSPVANDITDVQFVSASTGYIVVTNKDNMLYQGAVYKTTDGGYSWLPVDAGNTAAYRSFFFSENEGYVIGSAFFAGNTISKISGGQPSAYHTLSMNPTAFNISIDFWNNQTGIVGGGEGQVYRTFNAGASWDTVQTMVSDTSIYAIRFLDERKVLAATAGNLIISFDTGRTWQVDFSSLTFDYPAMQSIARSAKDSFIAVGAGQTLSNQGLIYRWDNGFNTRELADRPLHGVAMCNDSIAYAVGDSGLIITNRTIPGTGIQTPVSKGEELSIFPNPGTGSFTVSFSLPHTLRIFDAAGRLVLENSTLSLSHTIDLSAFANGNYIAEAETAKGRLNRKLLLQR